MIHRSLAFATSLVALVAVPRLATAQVQGLVPPGDTPQWLKDRKYSEGIGIRTGDFEVHPGIAGEVGYDSNWFVRSTRVGALNGPPVLPALEFRVTPSLALSTLGPQRREGASGAALPDVAFRTGISGTYREFVGISSDPGAGSLSDQRNFSVLADARLDIEPERPVGGSFGASYGRFILPNSASSNPDLAFTHDDVSAGADLAIQPGGGMLDWHFGYQFRDSVFENSVGAPFDNMSNEVSTRGRWKFGPKTALLHETTVRFLSYADVNRAAQQGLLDATPVRTRVGLNGLISDRFAALAMIGWGASFVSTVVPQQHQYDSPIGQAELRWFLSANPGMSSPSDVGLALSSIAVGYTRDFQTSYLSNFYGSDRGYVRFAYFFAGRVLTTLEGGVGAVEYPTMYWIDSVRRHGGFTDVRTDVTLFGEYRITDSIGVNATVRETANFSNVHNLADSEADQAASLGLDMAWNRFEAFVGLRWFM
jgi:hypothetical protein